MTFLSSILRKAADAIDSGAATFCARCRHVRALHDGENGHCQGKGKIPTLSQLLIGAEWNDHETPCDCACFSVEGN